MLEILVRNWPLKLLSVLLAFALWVAVTGEGTVVQDYTVPVDIALRDGYTMVGSVPTTGSVRLRGPESVIRRIDPLRHEMELYVDLLEASPGERTVQLGADMLVGLPRGVEVAQILPDRLSVLLDWELRRTLPIVPSFRGEPAEGYQFYAAHVTPEELTVEGPKSEVETLKRLRTDPINLDGRAQSFIARVGAVPDSPEVRVVEVGLLSVRVEIDAAAVEVAFDDVPVVLAGQVFEAAATPSKLRVAVSGPQTLLERLEPGQQIRAVVDVAGLAPRAESYHLSARVELVDLTAAELARVTVQSVSQDKVRVRLSDRRISE